MTPRQRRTWFQSVAGVLLASTIAFFCWMAQQAVGATHELEKASTRVTLIEKRQDKAEDKAEAMSQNIVRLCVHAGVEPVK